MARLALILVALAAALPAQAEKVIRNRVDKWGVTEPDIKRKANNQIQIQLPGFQDPEKAKELKLEPRARFVATAVAGTSPTIMLDAPIPASKKALAKAGLSVDDIDIWEVNEAFASVPLATRNEVGFDGAKMNVNGGAIALGHALGNSGARLTTTLVHEMKRREARFGVVSMCIGFGMGAAAVFEREPN
mgnify:CR=1 FL=1